MGIRLNKAISDTGICSRREADKLIEQKKVIVNGALAILGTRVCNSDCIYVNGQPLKQPPPTVYLAFYKPRGITCTTDITDPDNIIDYINYPQRIFTVGRLDKDSEGLILLTNDGNIVNKILRDGNLHEKEYLVTVNKLITPSFEKRMEKGVPILGTITKPCKVTKETATCFRIILTQGLNRQIRRMCNALGYEVERLQRVRIMHLTIKGLNKGDWRILTPQELETLNALVKKSVETEEASFASALKKRFANKKETINPKFHSKQKSLLNARRKKNKQKSRKNF
ncbi:MAG: 23S rRNA pseudouridine(2604) synthase RluF [Bacteroidales bacterium]